MGTARAPRRPAWTAWGRAAASRFDGEAEGLSVDGEVSTFTLGADAAMWARWLAGVAVSLERGRGRVPRPSGDGPREPWHGRAREHAHERASLSALRGERACVGVGGPRLRHGRARRSRWRTGKAGRPTPRMEMAAAGARGVLVPGGDAGIEVAARTDAQFVRMRSEAARGSDGGNLAATQSDTSRVRVDARGLARLRAGGWRRADAFP